MKALLVIILFLLPRAYAAIIISPGVSVTNAHRSDEKDMTGKKLVSFDSSMGINIEAEWTTLNESIGLTLGGLWRGGLATAQYSYTNPDNPLDSASVKELKASSSSFSGFVGPRFRFINMKYFKIFAGAGWNPGILYLNYDENKFILANGSAVGFKEKEERPFQGTYIEVGAELHAPKGGSLRLLGRQSQIRTQRFETLGDKKLNFTLSFIALQYMHIF